MITIDIASLNIKPGDRVLDLGCGEGRHLHALYEYPDLYLVGVDLSFDSTAVARQGFEDAFGDLIKSDKRFGFSVANANQLPFEDETFDLIICSEVLEHIPNYRGVLQELQRLLSPGGSLAISVPRYWPEWVCWKLSRQYHETPGGHIRIFRSNSLTQDVEKYGFKYLRKHWAHALHVPYWWLRCLFWKTQESSRLVKLYHKFLVWDLMKKPNLTRILEKITNPLMGKSVVLYFAKEGS